MYVPHTSSNLLLDPQRFLFSPLTLKNNLSTSDIHQCSFTPKSITTNGVDVLSSWGVTDSIQFSGGRQGIELNAQYANLTEKHITQTILKPSLY